MLKGICPICGAYYCGWALKSARNQTCEHCGVGLLITDDAGNTFTGYSPFTAPEYRIKDPARDASPEGYCNK